MAERKSKRNRGGAVDIGFEPPAHTAASLRIIASFSDMDKMYWDSVFLFVPCFFTFEAVGLLVGFCYDNERVYGF